MFSRETFSLSDSLAGTTGGVFTAFPLNSFRGEVDGWEWDRKAASIARKLTAACVTFSKLSRGQFQFPRLELLLWRNRWAGGRFRK